MLNVVAPRKNDTSQKAEGSPPMMPMRLLYVESDPVSGLFYQLLLQSYGFAVDLAEDAHAALAQFGSDAVHAVMISHNTASSANGNNGFNLAAEIKQQNPAIPVVMISACKSVVEDAPRFVEGAFWTSAPVGDLIELLQHVAQRPAFPPVFPLRRSASFIGLPVFVA